MIYNLRPEFACKLLLVMSSALIVFHVFNILGLIPFNIIWLGFGSGQKALFLGLLSILLNGIIFLCAVVKCNYVDMKCLKPIVESILPFVFWWLVGNTVANLFSKSMIEVIVFTPVLLVLTVCVFMIKDSTDTPVK